MSSFLRIVFFSYASDNMVFADTPENSAIENDAPAVSERFPSRIKGRARAAILLVQFKDSINVATSSPMEMKKIRRISGHIRLGQSCERMSAGCIWKIIRLDY